VIHKTIVVHDRNNIQRTIIVNQDTPTGTCFITQSQIAADSSNTNNLLSQLLDQCISVTILRG
jgi:hypothetical protein